MTMQIAPADHAATSQVVSTTTAAGVTLPDLLARVTKLAGLPLRAETATAIGEGWTKQPAAEVLYFQGRGYWRAAVRCFRAQPMHCGEPLSSTAATRRRTSRSATPTANGHRDA